MHFFYKTPSTNSCLNFCYEYIQKPAKLVIKARFSQEFSTQIFYNLNLDTCLSIKVLKQQQHLTLLSKPTTTNNTPSISSKATTTWTLVTEAAAAPNTTF
jgi:hypothetical protein